MGRIRGGEHRSHRLLIHCVLNNYKSLENRKDDFYTKLFLDRVFANCIPFFNFKSMSSQDKQISLQFQWNWCQLHKGGHMVQDWQRLTTLKSHLGHSRLRIESLWEAFTNLKGCRKFKFKCFFYRCKLHLEKKLLGGLHFTANFPSYE